MNDKQAKLVRALRDNPVAFARLVGFTLLVPEVHNPWITEMINGREDCTLLGHRGSYKTTCLSFAFALLCVLCPNKTILFIRKTDGDVIEIIAQTRKILETPLFSYIVRTLYGVQLVLTTSSAYKIDTNLNTGSRGQVQLQGMGLKSSITGKHADLIFTDDIVNRTDRISRAEREETKRAYQELQNIKNRGGRIMNTGTPWHKEDCIATEMSPPKISRILTFTVYETGLVSQEKQERLRQSMSPSLYAANYELRHIADADALFSEPRFYHGDPSDIHNAVAHIDAAYGGEDYTAYTAMKRKPDGSGYIGYGLLRHGHVDKHLRHILSVHEKIMAGTIHCEKNGDKGYLARDIKRAGVPASEYQERENKYIKIATFLRRAWPLIEWLPDTDPDYLSQILDYTENAEHDDAPDSAASIIRVLDGRPKVIAAPSYMRGGL